MRRRMLILTLALGLVATTAHTEDVTIQLEYLVMTQKPQLSPLHDRIEKFLKKHKVKRSEYYAKLIIKHPMPDEQKKVFAAIIVPESRGDANAVSSAGATGAWQVMPSWKRILKIKGSLKNPEVNLNAAVRVYNIHAIDAKHDPHKTLVYYSGRTPGYATKVQRLVKTI